jgi:hypothetical protein
VEKSDWQTSVGESCDAELETPTVSVQIRKLLTSSSRITVAPLNLLEVSRRQVLTRKGAWHQDKGRVHSWINVEETTPKGMKPAVYTVS